MPPYTQHSPHHPAAMYNIVGLPKHLNINHHHQVQQEQSSPEKTAQSLMHHHSATVCSRLTWFSPKCSFKISVYQSMQNLYQVFKYSLINNQICYERRHPACEHDTSDS